MSEDTNRRVIRRTRRSFLQATAGLGTAAVGGASTTAASSNLDISYSGGGGGGTSTESDTIMTSANIEIEFSDEIAFGPDEDRGFRITNIDTGATLRCTATEAFTVPAEGRIELSDLHDRDGTISDEPELQLNPELQFYSANLEGDFDIFTGGPVFSTYTVEIIENLADPNSIATTAEATRAISLERPPIEQTGTSGEINLQLEFPEALESSWFVEFSPFRPDDGFVFERTDVPNAGTDTIEWTSDFSGSDPGSYNGWQVAVYPNEDAGPNDRIWATTGYPFVDADSITIDADSETPAPEVDTTLTLANVETDAWQLTAIDGENATAPTDENNPPIEIEQERRYRIINNGWDTHPIAFESSDETTLLSQNSKGEYEDDESVNWIDDGDSVEFTLTESLDNDLEKYVCTVHPSMIGSIGTDAGDPSGGSTTISDYEDSDGSVQTDGLLRSIEDWRNGNADTDVLLDVIDAWRGRSP